MLLAFYALGLAVPFILSALAFSTFSGVFRFFRDHYRAITFVSGVVLIAMGVLLYTNELTRLNSEALPADGRPRDQLLQRDLGRPGRSRARLGQQRAQRLERLGVELGAGLGGHDRAAPRRGRAPSR